MAVDREIWRGGRKIAADERAAEGADDGTADMRAAMRLEAAAAEGGGEETATKTHAETAAAPEAEEKTPAPIRAINEDDDGYDPYSDLHDRPEAPPLFESDPWR